MAIRSAPRHALVGRDAELAQLLEQLEQAETITFVHGVAGIGKSALLAALCERAVERGHDVFRIDCRTTEPTQNGFLSALAATLGLDGADAALDHVCGAIARRTAPVLVLDDYEVFRLLDTWMRQIFVPALPESVRVVIAGREAPVARWLAMLRPLVVAIEPLPHRDSVALLTRLDVPDGLASRIADLVRGHPLALTLAASTARERPELSAEDIASHRAAGELASLYLDGIDDVQTRDAIEAASVVRRVNVGLLAAMLPERDGRESYDRLSVLPFVERRHDGLVVHDVVREAIAASLLAADPVRHRDYRTRAWRKLRAELRDVGSAARRDSADLWRYSADMLYLFGNPAVREAYFPSGGQSVAIEPATADDWPSIARIANRHLDADEARIVARWWHEAPHTFVVARDRDSLVVSFLIFVDGRSIVPPAVPEDPVVRQWADDLRSDPLGRSELAQGLRLWLDVDHGDAPCGSQAAGFLDCKRSYMVLRPRLARMYLAMRDPATYFPILQQLEFTLLDAGPASLGGAEYTTGRLDFGAGSVDGWLARLVAAELALDEESPLDERSREVRIDGRTAQLTRLEFGVMATLARQPGRAVSRRRLIEEVWGYEFDGGSNIVDSVVRSLRRKLGDAGSVVESVRGVGYRLPHGWETQLR